MPEPENPRGCCSKGREESHCVLQPEHDGSFCSGFGEKLP